MNLKYNVGNKVVINGYKRYYPDWVDGDILEIVTVDENDCAQPYRVRNLRTNELRWPVGIQNYIFPYQLKKKNATIITKKVWRGNTKCREIVEFKNVMTRDELPSEYINGHPMFFVCDVRGSYFEVDESGKPDWKLSSRDRQRIMQNFDVSDIDTNGYGFILSQGDVWSEENFQKIVGKMRKAGERLAMVRRKEKQAKEEERKRAEWSGTEEVEI